MSSGGVLVRLLTGAANLDGWNLDRRLAAFHLYLRHGDIRLARADADRAGLDFERRGLSRLGPDRTIARLEVGAAAGRVREMLIRPV